MGLGAFLDMIEPIRGHLSHFNWPIGLITGLRNFNLGLSVLGSHESFQNTKG